MTIRLRVAVETPQHTGLGAPLDYESEHELAPGTLVRVPLGRREVTGSESERLLPCFQPQHHDGLVRERHDLPKHPLGSEREVQPENRPAQGWVDGEGLDLTGSRLLTLAP